ncbi:hypothetical protein ACIBG7_15070 [Nonomuraea sp. NPDC050328]|uniref:hypothetical protein n=1 Tax=Nonomuraea sp. NPDC050328 TaxID=3364361 RepID=UPI0037AD1C86
MTELAIPDHHGQELAAAAPPAPASPLVQWALEARQAAQIAESLARTSFVPASFRGKPEDVTAAILAGQELGLAPMATLRSIDVIQGTPGLRAHAMRGLIQARGHRVVLAESTDTRCVMRGQRRGEQEWQEVEWTIDRAAQMGLTGKDQWKKQPKTMLIARATGEICRLIASDVLHAMPYAAEELETDATFYTAEVVPGGRVTSEEVLRGRGQPNPAAPDVPRAASNSQLRDLSVLMTACGITANTGKGSTTLNDQARFAWLTDFLGVEVSGTTKSLTADQADAAIAHLRQQQVQDARRRAEMETQIGSLFDGMDTRLSGPDRLRDLSRLLGRPITGPADLTDQELVDVADILRDCDGLITAWDAALDAIETQRQESSS